jgi:hypothetical protein
MKVVEKIRQHIVLDSTNAGAGNSGVQETAKLA